MGKLYTTIFSLFLSCIALPVIGLACDGSGYVINSLTDNNDGTFTINMTIHIAGGDYSGGILGGTQGFYFTTATPIVSVTPPSLTSLNGATFNASISGNTVTWGTPGSGPFFVNSNEPTQTFNVTVVVNGFPPNWNGGGMENNACPGGAGTNNPSPGYSGAFCLPPSVSIAPASVSACAGEPITLTAIASPGTSVTWSNGMTGSSITFPANNSGTVTGTVSNGCGSDSETVTINVTPLPTVAPIPGLDLCEGELITLSAQTQNADMVAWSNGFVGNPIVFSPTTSQVLTVSASSQCGTATENININVTPLPLLFVIQGDQSICQGQVVTLEVLVENADNFFWNTGPTSPSIMVSPGQTQVFTATASNQCQTLQENIIVDVLPLPQIDVIQGDQSICIGESVTLEVFTQDAQDVFWSNGASGSTQTFSPTQSGTYTVTANNDCGVVEEEIDVVVSTGPALEVIDGNQAICQGESATLTVSPEGADAIVWSNGSTDTTITVSPGQSEDFTVSLTNICGTTDTTFTIDILESPSIEVLQGDQEICIGDSATLEITAGLASSLEWSTGLMDSTALTVLPTQTTSYEVLAANSCGQADTSFTITVNPLPTVDIIDGGQTICTGQSATLSVETANEDALSWSNGATDTLITVSPGQTEAFTASVSNACGTDSEVITVTVNPTYDTNLELQACSGTAVTYNNTSLQAGDSQSFMLATVEGCDSVVHVSVIELPTYEASLQLEACTGSTVVYENTTLNPGDSQSFTLMTQNGCDSVVNVSVMELMPVEEDLELQTCPNSTLLYNGTELAPGDSQDFVFTGQNGCDSTVHVTVSELTAFTSSLELEACTGTTASYNGAELDPGDAQSFTLSASNGCDSVVQVTVLELPAFESALQLEACTGSTATFDGALLDPGDTQSFTYIAANGCDSTINVTVAELPVFASSLALEACTGTTASYNGAELDPGTAQSFTFTAANGCDSVVSVSVIELPVFESSLALEACPGTVVTYSGTDLPAGAAQSFTLTALNGCDSVVNVSVIELPVFESSLEFEACPGATVAYNGATLLAGESQRFTLTADNGCDSMVQVTVLELTTFESALQLEACTGSTALFDGTELQPGSAQSFTYTASNGCDSTIHVSVLELPVYDQELQLQACTGNTVAYNGMELGTGAMETFTFTSQAGCDSVVHVMVEEVDILEESLEFFTCPQTTVTYEGTSLAPGDTQQFQFISQNGCDSIVTVSVLALPIFETTLELEACTGTTVAYNGLALSPGDSQSFTFTAGNGCDSIVNVSVMELQVFESELELQACPGEQASYNGTFLPAGESQDFTLNAQNGCDSIVHVSVLELPTYEQGLPLQACLGTTLTYNGATLAPGDSQSFLLASQFGCDSVVNVSVEGVEIFETELELQACSGSSVPYNGTSLLAGEQQDFTFTSQIGCDSIVTVSVLELPTYEQELELQTCEGATTTYNGVTLAPGEEHDFLLTTAGGCDSLIHAYVLGVENILTNESRTICQGDSSLIFGVYQGQPGPYSAVFTSANGCDSTHTVMLATTPLPQPVAEIQASCPDKNNGVINLQVSGGAAPYTFSWNDGAFTPGRSELAPGNYTVVTTDARGCRQALSTTVPERSLEVEIETKDISCFGRKDGLITLQSDGANITYQLNGGPLQSLGFFSSLEAGQYLARAEDSYGCRYELGALLIEEPGQLLVRLPPDTTIQLGKPIRIQALTNQGGDLSFGWNPSQDLDCDDCDSPVASPPYSIRYEVTVRDSNGCVAEDDIMIFVNRKRNVYIPSAFSPNGDGKNDRFYIFGDETVVQIRSFQIFNRWGEPVYEIYGFPPNDPAFGWDGAFRGEPMNPAVFAYVAEVEFSDGEVALFKGDVTLAK